MFCKKCDWKEIQSTHESGPGRHRRYHWYICMRCGRIRFSCLVAGHYVEDFMRIPTPEILEAAGAFVRELEAEEAGE